MHSVLFYYTKDSSHLEILYEVIDVLLVAQIVASWEKSFYLEFIVQEALVPEVFTESSLRCELTIVREVIVPLLRVKPIMSALFVGDIVFDVKRVTVRHYVPTKF